MKVSDVFFLMSNFFIFGGSLESTKNSAFLKKSRENPPESLGLLVKKYRKPYVEEQILEPFQSEETSNDILKNYFNDLKKYLFFLFE